MTKRRQRPGPGYGNQPGYGGQPGYGNQPGYGGQPGNGSQPGHGNQPGHAGQPFGGLPPPANPPNAPPQQRGQPPAEKKSAWPVLRFFIKLAVLAAIFAGVFTFVLGVHICRGNQMYPFIMDGDLVITYKLDPYREGDAVVYRDPETGKQRLSRIAAKGPGEVDIADLGHLTVNGYAPDERVFYVTKKLPDSPIDFPCQLSADGYFLLDDFRTHGRDSRLFGEVHEEDLAGKVVYVFRRRGI